MTFKIPLAPRRVNATQSQDRMIVAEVRTNVSGINHATCANSIPP